MNWRWTTSEAMSYRVMDAFVAGGGNFLDSADIYSFWAKGCTGGSSETIIGTWMNRRRNRRDIVLATKVRGRMWPGATGEGLSRAHIIKACEDSLKRLRTDWIDLYQTHFADDTVPVEETMGALADLVRSGKVRYVGCSNYTPGQLAEALVAARQLGLPQYHSIQPFYNLFARDFEKDHVWLVRKYGVAVIPYSPLMGGFLTGKYRRDRPSPRSLRAVGLKWLMNDRGYKVIEALERMGRPRGKTVLQMALGWHLTHDWMTAPIIGANTPEQLREGLGGAGLRLSEDEMKELDGLTS
jgi:aryl-alcohol dehydrogenase-like predicted oxidoreductase